MYANVKQRVDTYMIYKAYQEVEFCCSSFDQICRHFTFFLSVEIGISNIGTFIHVRVVSFEKDLNYTKERNLKKTSLIVVS